MAGRCPRCICWRLTTRSPGRPGGWDRRCTSRCAMRTWTSRPRCPTGRSALAAWTVCATAWTVCGWRPSTPGSWPAAGQTAARRRTTMTGPWVGAGRRVPTPGGRWPGLPRRAVPRVRRRPAAPASQGPAGACPRARLWAGAVSQPDGPAALHWARDADDGRLHALASCVVRAAQSRGVCGVPVRAQAARRCGVRARAVRSAVRGRRGAGPACPGPARRHLKIPAGRRSEPGSAPTVAASAPMLPAAGRPLARWWSRAPRGALERRHRVVASRRG